MNSVHVSDFHRTTNVKGQHLHLEQFQIQRLLLLLQSESLLGIQLRAMESRHASVFHPSGVEEPIGATHKTYPP